MRAWELNKIYWKKQNLWGVFYGPNLKVEQEIKAYTVIKTTKIFLILSINATT